MTSTSVLSRSVIAVAMALSSLVANANSSSPITENSVDDVPVVITPTRLKQTPSDVPAAVTVITGTRIRELGLRNIPDALRLVPGMHVTQAAGDDQYRINYHGTNILVPRRMNVMIDGVSMYRPGLARVEWGRLPIAIEDIDRIEVTRGANSVTYGPNSLLAIVNIITKHPHDSTDFAMTASSGRRGDHSGTLLLGGDFNNTSWRASINHESDSGYDVLTRDTTGHDTTRITRFSARSVTAFGLDHKLDVTLGYAFGTSQSPFVDAFQISFPDKKFTETYLSANWIATASSNHESKLALTLSHEGAKQRWTTCVPTPLLLPEMFTLWQSNRSYALAISAGRVPRGGNTNDDRLAIEALAAIRSLGASASQRICTNPNQDLNQQRLDFEFQHTYVATPAFRIVGGVGVREDTGRSETFFGGTLRNRSIRAFANGEYRVNPALRLNAGAYFESDQINDHSFTPRIAANFDLAPNQTLRAVYSVGTRAPDSFEQNAIWTYSGLNSVPTLNGNSTVRFYQSGRGKGDLTNERIVNREIGYVFLHSGLRMQTDFKVFADKLTNLISEKPQVSNFNLSNVGEATLKGAEVQTEFATSNTLRVTATYAYLQSRTNQETERTHFSRHSGSFSALLRLPHQSKAAITHFFSSGNGIGQSRFERTDLNLSADWPIGSSKLNLSGTVRYHHTPTISFYQDTNRFIQNTRNSPWQFFVGARLNY
jgi:iron complex outermembrane recepter protein